jgi:glucosyl-3-phosphoglycerate synthase
MSPLARAWEQGHTHHHREFPADRLAAERTETVSVCLPARDEAPTIRAIVTSLLPLLDAGVIDQLVVVDDSSDGTADIARAAGAEVYAQDALTPDRGPVLGKGDAMWRALSVLTGEVICFLDADSEAFGDHFARGLLGPLLIDAGGAGPTGGTPDSATLQFVKGFYRRPFKVGDLTLADGGGRVTEIAARRSLLERLSFTTGYGVDIALLIDVYREVGLNAMAQVDLDVRQNSHQTLHDLRPMARAVLEAVNVRLVREGRLAGPLTDLPVERPPMATARAAV